MDEYYKILGLKPGASLEEIKQAYRDHVRVWHPDRFLHDARLRKLAEEKLKEINKAYEVLQIMNSLRDSSRYDEFIFSQASKPSPEKNERRAESETKRTETNFNHHQQTQKTPKQPSQKQKPKNKSILTLLKYINAVLSPGSRFAVVILLVVGLAFLYGLLQPSPPITPTPKPSHAPRPAQAQAPAPLPIPDTAVESLPNGTNIIKPRGPKGLGTLTVKNGTSRDAVVKLCSSNPPYKNYRFVYVCSKNEITIRNVSSGAYVLKFSSGNYWDTEAKKFVRNVSYSRFQDLMEFKHIEEEDGIRFSKFEVTLHPVISGNARTDNIDESDFQDGAD